MVIAGIPLDELRHTRAAQEWLAEGRRDEAAAMTLRLLNRRCGPLSEATTDALLDFQGSADLTTWPAVSRRLVGGGHHAVQPTRFREMCRLWR